VRGVRPHVCHRLRVIGLLRMPVAPCRDVPSAGVERTPLTRRAWRQEARDGLPVFGHQAMPVAPIERALLTRQTSARSLVPAELRLRNPLRGTDGGGNALKDRHGLGLKRLPGASQESTQPHEWIREPAEPTGRTPAAEQLGPRPRPAQGPRAAAVAGLRHGRWRSRARLSSHTRPGACRPWGASSCRKEVGRFHSPWRMSPMAVYRSQPGLTYRHSTKNLFFFNQT
jgi:hypothetical protein